MVDVQIYQLIIVLLIAYILGVLTAIILSAPRSR
jgi:hypothetical protein